MRGPHGIKESALLNGAYPILTLFDRSGFGVDENLGRNCPSTHTALKARKCPGYAADNSSRLTWYPDRPCHWRRPNSDLIFDLIEQFERRSLRAIKLVEERQPWQPQ